MQWLRRWVLFSGFLALIFVGSAAFTPVQHVTALDSGINLWDLGSQSISGTTWTFDSDFAIDAGAWESVTVSNYGYCWVGPNDPRAGTAHAGAVFWFTELKTQPPTASGSSYTGTLKSDRSHADGQVMITTAETDSGATTHVHITISGDDLMYFQDNTLDVCLLGSS